MPSPQPQLMLWVAWLVIKAEDKISDDEALLFRHLVRIVEHHQVKDDQLAQLVDVDADEVWRRLDAESGDRSDIVEVANRVAKVDGEPAKKERAVLAAIEDRCRRA